MTLIYSKRTLDNEFIICADTQITANNYSGGITERELPNSIPGALKLFVLNEYFTLGCAGVHEFAVSALKDIWISNFKREIIISIIDQYYRASIECSDGTDFLLCDFERSLTYKWTDGFDKTQTESDCWIGNENAALALKNGRENFDDILSSNEYDNVGGLRVCVESCHRRFKYQPITSVQVETEYYGGGFHYSIATPHSSLPYLAAYFQSQNWGYLYNHLITDKPTKVESESPDEFVGKLRSITGVDFLMATSQPTDGGFHASPGKKIELRLVNPPKCDYVWSKTVRQPDERNHK